MVTRVGQQISFIEAIKELVELDYDAIEAYEVAIARLENIEYKDKFREFKDDHKRHVKKLSEFLIRCGEVAPTGSDNTKNLLAKGKVMLASLSGDKNILNSMLSNEEDTNIAYERMNSRTNESSDTKIAKVIAKGLADKKQHKSWLQVNISKIS